MPRRPYIDRRPVPRTRAGHQLTKHDLRALAQAYTEEALLTVAEVMRCDDPALALRASEILLDRGHGRAVTPMAEPTTDGTRLTLMHLIATQRVAEQLQREWEAAQRNGKTNGSGTNGSQPVVDYSQPALE